MASAKRAFKSLDVLVKLATLIVFASNITCVWVRRINYGQNPIDLMQQQRHIQPANAKTLTAELRDDKAMPSKACNWMAPLVAINFASLCANNLKAFVGE